MSMPLVILGLCLLLAAPLAAADQVVIANPQSGVGRLTQEEVVNIYLGRYRRLTTGLTAEPLDFPHDTEQKMRFYRNLVGKSLAEINAYWARLVFSGKTLPPQVVANAEEAMERVSNRPGALAYVDRAKVDRRVVIVFELGE